MDLVDLELFISKTRQIFGHSFDGDILLCGGKPLRTVGLRAAKRKKGTVRHKGTTGLPKHVIKLVSDAIDSSSSELRRLNLEIWNNSEVRFKEEKACKLLAERVSSQARFLVAACERTVCYNAEYDALPELGHASGHNLITTSTLALAVGVSAAMKTLNIPGTLTDCSVVLMTHGMPDFSTARAVTKASWKFRAKFYGKTAHTTPTPQQIQKTESIQSVILDAGKAPNIIPDYAEGSFSLCAIDSPELERLRIRVIPIYEGAAAAPGCTVELFWDALYEDVVTNMSLANRYTQYMINDLGLTPADIPSPSDSSPKAGLGTDYAHMESFRAGKTNALVGLDVLLDDALYRQVQQEWVSDMKQRGRLVE
ncbi:hypothetical protein BDV23DRAFT_177157 [Aspergillus alliaceus]|uniref:Peptidase M20 domain-containing protein 2 n=1 Tax=Petromyces alliaceus TaxID=209559 RepID=A0A5N7BR63_PETAA|nr:hypothetical protein BDV23DRAFT_177157 [Aspergillus alliaceus]